MNEEKGFEHLKNSEEARRETAETSSAEQYNEETVESLINQSETVVESEEERVASVNAKRTEIDDAFVKAMQKRDLGTEEYNPKTVPQAIPEKTNRWKRALITLGLGGLLAGSAAKANATITPEDSLKRAGDAKEKMFADSSERKVYKKPTVEKITSLNVAGEKVGNLEMEGEILVPYSDTTKQVALLKFKGKEEDPKAIDNMITALQKKGYKLAIPGMLEKTMTENPKLVSLLDKNRIYVASLGENMRVGDDTKLETQLLTTVTTETIATPEGKKIVEHTKVDELKPQITAVKTFVPGVHQINKNDDLSTIGYDYAIIVYKDVQQEKTANYTDGLAKK